MDTVTLIFARAGLLAEAIICTYTFGTPEVDGTTYVDFADSPEVPHYLRGRDAKVDVRDLYTKAEWADEIGI